MADQARSFLDVLGPPDGRLRLSRGQYLFRIGDRVRHLYAVGRGRVRLERSQADGSLVILHTARSGQSFAEASLFSETYHCDAWAETHSVVVSYDRTAVLEAMDGREDLTRRFVLHLAQQVRELRSLLEIRNIRSANDRVLQYLRFRSLEGSLQEGRPLRHMASEVGLADETFYRVLAELEEQGRIRRQGKYLDLVRKKPPRS